MVSPEFKELVEEAGKRLEEVEVLQDRASKAGMMQKMQLAELAVIESVLLSRAIVAAMRELAEA